MRAPLVPFLLLLGTSTLTSAGLAQSTDFPKLLRGTPVTLQLDETLNSATAHIGQRVAFEVTADVVMEDRIVIPAGCAALGTVSQVTHHGWTSRLGRSTAKLDVDIDMVRLPDGQIVPLTITTDENGDHAPGANSIAANMVPSPATSHMVVAHRKDTLIPEGTIVRALVGRDTIIVRQTASVSN